MDVGMIGAPADQDARVAKKSWVAPAIDKVPTEAAEGAGARGDDGFDAGTS